MKWHVYRMEPDGVKTVIAFADDEHQAALIMDSERDKVDNELQIGAEPIREAEKNEDHH